MEPTTTEKTNGAAAAQTTAAQDTTTGESKAIEQTNRAPLAFEPSNMDESWRIAMLFAKADLIPDDLKGKPNNVLLVLLAGRELGLSPMQSLRQIYVVKGKTFISSQLKLAMVEKSGECEYFKCLHTDATKATFETKRKGRDPQTLSFGIEDAQRAGLVAGGGNWVKWPQNMCRWRCISALCDYVYPDVIGGLGSHEEYEDIRAQERGAPYLERVTGPGGEAPQAPVVPLSQQSPPAQKAAVKSAEAQTTEPEKPKAPTQSEAVKMAGGITNSEVNKIPPAPVDDLEVKLEKIFAEAKTSADLTKAAKLISQLKSIDRSAHWRSEFTRKSEELNRAG